MKKTLKKIILLGILFLLISSSIIFVFNNQELYSTPIGKITNIENDEFKQKISLVLINTDQKGQSIVIENGYTKEGIYDERYKKGDRIFISLPDNSILGVKRDGYLSIVLGIFIFFLIAFSGRRGFFILLSFIANIVIFVTVILGDNNGEDIWLKSNLLMIAFTLISIILAVGINKKSLSAIISTIVSTYAIILMVKLILLNVHIDYAFLENVSGRGNLPDYFLSQILITGLGAIMDISVSIATLTGELKEKNPNLSFKASFIAGKNLGKDIMGLMINVLMFTFISETIPEAILKRQNQVSLVTIYGLHEPFMWYRLLLGGIGILISIPIAIIVTNTFFRLGSGWKE